MTKEREFQTKLIIDIIYHNYGKLSLNIKEMSTVIGISKSNADSMFGKGEEHVIKYKLLPEWRYIGEYRSWYILKILDWLENTEKKALKKNISEHV